MPGENPDFALQSPRLSASPAPEYASGARMLSNIKRWGARVAADKEARMTKSSGCYVFFPSCTPLSCPRNRA